MESHSPATTNNYSLLEQIWEKKARDRENQLRSAKKEADAGKQVVADENKPVAQPFSFRSAAADPLSALAVKQTPEKLEFDHPVRKYEVFRNNKTGVFAIFARRDSEFYSLDRDIFLKYEMLSDPFTFSRDCRFYAANQCYRTLFIPGSSHTQSKREDTDDTEYKPCAQIYIGIEIPGTNGMLLFKEQFIQLELNEKHSFFRQKNFMPESPLLKSVRLLDRRDPSPSLLKENAEFLPELNFFNEAIHPTAGDEKQELSLLKKVYAKRFAFEAVCHPFGFKIYENSCALDEKEKDKLEGMVNAFNLPLPTAKTLLSLFNTYNLLRQLTILESNYRWIKSSSIAEEKMKALEKSATHETSLPFEKLLKQCCAFLTRLDHAFTQDKKDILFNLDDTFWKDLTQSFRMAPLGMFDKRIMLPSRFNSFLLFLELAKLLPEDKRFAFLSYPDYHDPASYPTHMHRFMQNDPSTHLICLKFLIHQLNSQPTYALPIFTILKASDKNDNHIGQFATVLRDSDLEYPYMPPGKVYLGEKTLFCYTTLLDKLYDAGIPATEIIKLLNQPLNEHCHWSLAHYLSEPAERASLDIYFNLLKKLLLSAPSHADQEEKEPVLCSIHQMIFKLLKVQDPHGYTVMERLSSEEDNEASLLVLLDFLNHFSPEEIVDLLKHRGEVGNTFLHFVASRQKPSTVHKVIHWMKQGGLPSNSCFELLVILNDRKFSFGHLIVRTNNQPLLDAYRELLTQNPHYQHADAATKEILCRNFYFDKDLIQAFRVILEPYAINVGESHVFENTLLALLNVKKYPRRRELVSLDHAYPYDLALLLWCTKTDAEHLTEKLNTLWRDIACLDNYDENKLIFLNRETIINNVLRPSGAFQQKLATLLQENSLLLEAYQMKSDPTKKIAFCELTFYAFGKIFGIDPIIFINKSSLLEFVLLRTFGIQVSQTGIGSLRLAEEEDCLDAEAVVILELNVTPAIARQLVENINKERSNYGEQKSHHLMKGARIVVENSAGRQIICISKTLLNSSHFLDLFKRTYLALRNSSNPADQLLLALERSAAGIIEIEHKIAAEEKEKKAVALDNSAAAALVRSLPFLQEAPAAAPSASAAIAHPHTSPPTPSL